MPLQWAFPCRWPVSADGRSSRLLAQQASLFIPVTSPRSPYHPLPNFFFYLSPTTQSYVSKVLDCKERKCTLPTDAGKFARRTCDRLWETSRGPGSRRGHPAPVPGSQALRALARASPSRFRGGAWPQTAQTWVTWLRAACRPSRDECAQGGDTALAQPPSALHTGR